MKTVSSHHTRGRPDHRNPRPNRLGDLKALSSRATEAKRRAPKGLLFGRFKYATKFEDI